MNIFISKKPESELDFTPNHYFVWQALHGAAYTPYLTDEFFGSSPRLQQVEDLFDAEASRTIINGNGWECISFGRLGRAYQRPSPWKLTRPTRWVSFADLCQLPLIEPARPIMADFCKAVSGHNFAPKI